MGSAPEIRRGRAGGHGGCSTQFERHHPTVMASVNKLLIIGNLGADPELKHLPSNGTAVCNLRVATTETWKDKSGEKREETEWHRVQVYGVQAENCHRYLEKGASVYVEGRIKTRSWDDKDGTKRYSTEVVAERVKFLSSPKSKGGGGTGWGAGEGPSEPPSDSGGMPEDDIPFIRAW